MTFPNLNASPLFPCSSFAKFNKNNNRNFPRSQTKHNGPYKDDKKRWIHRGLIRRLVLLTLAGSLSVPLHYLRTMKIRSSGLEHSIRIFQLWFRNLIRDNLYFPKRCKQQIEHCMGFNSFPYWNYNLWRQSDWLQWPKTPKYDYEKVHFFSNPKRQIQILQRWSL